MLTESEERRLCQRNALKFKGVGGGGWAQAGTEILLQGEQLD